MIHLIDIETTGLDPEVHEVIEVGIVSAEKGQIKVTHEFSLPFDPAKADPKALEVNGWGKRRFAEPLLPSTEEGAAWLDDIIRPPDLVASWHSLLDFGFLGKLCRDHLGGEPWGHRNVIDLPSLVMGKMGVLTSGSSRELMEQLGLDPEFLGRHTALADAHANFLVYKALGLFEVLT